MTFISVLIALLLEKRVGEVVAYRRFEWFEQLTHIAAEQFSDQKWWRTWAPPLLIIFAVPAVYWLIFSGESGFLGALIQLILSVVILVYCLGPVSIDEWLKPYFSALERGDFEGAKNIVGQTLDVGSIENVQQLGRFVTQHIFVESHQRYFAVIFWFIILGPIGALIYRLTYIYAWSLAKHEEHLECSSRLLSILNWLPARITGFSFALAGDFVCAQQKIKDYLTEYSCHTYAILSGAGLGASQCDASDCQDPLTENKNAIELAERAMVIWIVVLALMTIFGVL